MAAMPTDVTFHWLFEVVHAMPCVARKACNVSETVHPVFGSMPIARPYRPLGGWRENAWRPVASRQGARI